MPKISTIALGINIIALLNTSERITQINVITEYVMITALNEAYPDFWDTAMMTYCVYVILIHGVLTKLSIK